MKHIQNFEEFVNESIINEGKFTDVWPTMPYGDWKSEYDIPNSIQKELYLELQSKLGSKSVKVKEDIEDRAKSPVFNEFITMPEWNMFYNWTNRSESTTVAAFELKNGEIAVAVYQTYSRSDPKTTQMWTITK